MGSISVANERDGREGKEACVQRLMQSFYRVARCRQAMFQSVLSQYGVTLHQFHLLWHIRSNRQIKVTEISDLMLVSTPTASRMINTLFDMGFVMKKKSHPDRRSTYLELTEKGEEIITKVYRRQMELINVLLEALSEKELDNFLDITESIAERWMTLLKESQGEGESNASLGLPASP
jgi:DNA-binding MarR family transcriptional regulator